MRALRAPCMMDNCCVRTMISTHRVGKCAGLQYYELYSFWRHATGDIYSYKMTAASSRRPLLPPSVLGAKIAKIACLSALHINSKYCKAPLANIVAETACSYIP